MNQREKENGALPLGMTVALLGSGVGLGLGLAGLGALWLQRTDMLARARAADVDKQLAAIRERQQANDEQLAADLTLFRQVLQAYQPTPDQGAFGSFVSSSAPAFPPAPSFPPSVLAAFSPAAEAAYEAINRNRNTDSELPSLAAQVAARVEDFETIPSLWTEPLDDFNAPAEKVQPIAKSELSPELSAEIKSLFGPENE